MNQENLDYLKEKLKFSGFDDKANTELETQINSGKDDFKIPINLEIEGKNMGFDLYFRKSATDDRYYFNKFDATLNNVDERIEPKIHTFYQNQGVTAKEAFNLMEGRAVQKSLLNQENEPYKAWLQLDLGAKENNGNFKMNTYYESYGFDLKKSLENLPIKELQDPAKSEWLVKALTKGNVYPVVMESKGKEEVMFVEASPKFKSINVYDAQMRPVKTADLKFEAKAASVDTSKKKDLEQPKSVKEKILERMAEPKSPPLSKSKGKRM